MWHQLNEEQKVPFMVEANRLRDEHKLANPGYRYQPKRRTKLVVSTVETIPQAKVEPPKRANKKRPVPQDLNREVKHLNGKRHRRIHDAHGQLPSVIKSAEVESRFNYYGSMVNIDVMVNDKLDLETSDVSEDQTRYILN